MNTLRKAEIVRETKETRISLALNLDGTGTYDVQTPIGFLNHMLELFACHGRFDLQIKASGDVVYDDHHVIEDIGIVLGQVITRALGEKRGIRRYGSVVLPMDEVLCLCAVDLSGRYTFRTDYEPVREKVNDFPTEMMKHFFGSITVNAMMNLHIRFPDPGENEHHRLEAAFKAFARALRQAVEVDPLSPEYIPSTKGNL